MNTYGKSIIGELFDAVTVPADTSTSSAIVYTGESTNAGLIVSVYANEAISIADTKTLSIRPVVGGATPSTEIYALPYSRTASGSAITFAAGDCIFEWVLPPTQLGDATYLKLIITTTDAAASGKIDGFLHAVV